MNATKNRQRVKRARSIRLCLPLSDTGWGVVEIQVGKMVNDYFVRRIPSDFGDGFQLEKFTGQGGEIHHVNLSDEGHLCDCQGYEAHGHCKHVSGLVKLRQVGKL